jgi:hypothetical protein
MSESMTLQSAGLLAREEDVKKQDLTPSTPFGANNLVSYDDEPQPE